MLWKKEFRSATTIMMTAILASTSPIVDKSSEYTDVDIQELSAYALLTTIEAEKVVDVFENYKFRDEDITNSFTNPTANNDMNVCSVEAGLAAVQDTSFNIENLKSIDDWKKAMKLEFDKFIADQPSITMEKNSQDTVTMQCLKKISAHMNELVGNSKTNNVEDAWNILKESFKLNDKIASALQITQDLLEANYCISRGSWSKNALKMLNEHVIDHISIYKSDMIDWVENEIKEDYCTGNHAQVFWKDRGCISVKYFNANLYNRKHTEVILKFKRSLYHMLTIMGTNSFINKVIVNLYSNMNFKDEINDIPLQLNTLASHYFMFPFFEILKRTMNLKGKINKECIISLYNILDMIQDGICDALTRKELLKSRTPIFQKYSVDILLRSKIESNSGILDDLLVKDILMMIDGLNDAWVKSIENSNEGVIAYDSYLVAIFLETLKHVVVVSSDFLRIAFGMDRDMSNSPQESRKLIYQYLTMINFDIERVRNLVSIKRSTVQS